MKAGGWRKNITIAWLRLENKKLETSLRRPLVSKLIKSMKTMMIYDMPKLSFHPGLYLQELLVWQNISPDEFSDITGVPRTEITDLIAKRRGVDKTISEVLAAYFGNSSRFWLDLQKRFDCRD